jgi:hypothetical protein
MVERLEAAMGEQDLPATMRVLLGVVGAVLAGGGIAMLAGFTRGTRLTCPEDTPVHLRREMAIALLAGGVVLIGTIFWRPLIFAFLVPGIAIVVVQSRIGRHHHGTPDRM